MIPFLLPVSHAHSNVKAIQKLNETELRLGLDSKTSWHDEYKDSAYIFVGERKYTSANGSVLGPPRVNLALNSNTASST